MKTNRSLNSSSVCQTVRMGLISLVFMGLTIQSAVWAAPMLTLTPSAITWNTNAFVNVDLSGISTGADVNLTIWADIDRNGLVGTNDVQIMQFQLKDGVTNSLGSKVVVCDTNGVADGHIQSLVSYHGHTDLEQLVRASGPYVWQATYANGAPITSAVFTVTEQGAGTTWITGSVQVLTNLSPMAGAPLAGAAIFLEVFSHIAGYTPSAWTDTNGNFILRMPQGMPTGNVARVMAVKQGFFTSETGPDGVTPMSVYPFSQPLNTGTNALPSPLFLVAPIPGMVATLSGIVVDSASNALPGVVLIAQQPDSDRSDMSLAVSGTNGAFSIPWPQNGDSVMVHSMTAALNMRGLVGSALTVGPVLSDVSGLQLVCPVATTLVSGKVNNPQSNSGMSGVKVRVSSDFLGSENCCFISNGTFEVCFVGGSNLSGEVMIDSLQPARRVCLTSQVSGLTIPSSGTFTGLTFQTSPGFIVSGHVYDQQTNALVSGQVWASLGGGGTNVDQESPDLGGFYQLLVPSNTYVVGTGGFSGQGYVDQTWPGTISVSSNMGGIDFYLSQGVTISGHVSGGGSPLSNALVEVGLVTFPGGGGWDWQHIAGSSTDTNGDYSMSVPSGTNYTVRAAGPNGTAWLDQYFSNRVDISLADLVTAPASNVNFNLQAGAQIMGRVLGDGSPLSNAQVQAGIVTFREGGGWDWQFIAGSPTDTNGDYMLIVPPGTNYTMKAGGPDGASWIEQYFSNTVDISLAMLVTAQTNIPTTQIDFPLVRGMTIDGWVVDATNQPVSTGIGIGHWDGTNWVNAAMTGTDGAGHYSCIVAANTNYLVRINNGTYHDVFFSNKLSAAAADVVSAPPGVTISNVNFTLYDSAADTDRDGLPDYVEGYVTGTAPFNSNDCLRCTGIQSGGGLVTLSWASVNGKLYGVERSTNLLNASTWTSVAPVPVVASGSKSSLTDSNAPPRAHYRVLINY